MSKLSVMIIRQRRCELYFQFAEIFKYLCSKYVAFTPCSNFWTIFGIFTYEFHDNISFLKLYFYTLKIMTN